MEKEPKAKTNPPKLSFTKPEAVGEGGPDNPPNPNPSPSEPLVNENQSGEEYVSNPDIKPPEEQSREEILRTELLQLEQQLGVIRQKNIELTTKLSQMQNQKANYSDVSRKFRIFLNLLQGFATRGVFDQSELAKKPGSEHNIMRHIAGLTEVAQKATENRF